MPKYTGIYTTLEFCTNHQAFEYGVDVCYIDEDGEMYKELIEDGRCDTESEAWAAMYHCLSEFHKLDWYEGN